MMKQVRLGLLGLGTVGGGVAKLARSNAEPLARRAGLELVVQRACVRDLAKPRDAVDASVLTTDPMAVVTDPNVDVVVEVMGELEPARTVILAALAAGKPVVTANKAVIARHGSELLAAADAAGQPLLCEAAVGGGIPILKAIREGLVANRINQIAGIINGTCNYILTEMEARDEEFAAVLAEAQALGYAEADPSFDIGGIDAAHKLTILATMGFGIPLSFDAVNCQGIDMITTADIRYSSELGYRIKSLALAWRQNGGVAMSVLPTLIPHEYQLAAIGSVTNAVLVNGDVAGPTMYTGAGAGSEATASAVIADIVEAANGGCAPALGYPAAGIRELPLLAPGECVRAHYLRMQLRDEPGVLAGIARILGEHGISIEAIQQKESEDDSDEVPVVLLTGAVREADMADAQASIQALPSICQPILRLAVEHFENNDE